MPNENADTYVRWERTDEPGQDPSWDSQCGLVVEVWGKNASEYVAWSNPAHATEGETYVRNFVGTFPSKLTAQKAVQKEFEKTGTLVWEYDAPEREVKKRVRKEALAASVTGEQSTHPLHDGM